MRSSRVSLASFALVALVLGSFARAQAPRAPSLDGLLRAFASMPGLEARFVEEKTMSLLAVPLKSEGRIFFSPPGHLLRRIESPRPAELLVSGGTLRIRENGRVQELDLASRADVRPLVESLLWLFTGDREALETAFHVRFEAGRAWTLSLRPKHAPLDKLVTELRLTGDGLAVKTVEVHESSGDKSVMRILEANPRRTFDAKEKKRLFGVRGS
jgi:hypothetical protein